MDDEITRVIKSLDWLKLRLDKVHAQLDSNAVWLAMQLLKQKQWRNFRDERPEGKKRVLLWVDCGSGGFPVVAKVENDGVVWWWSYKGKSFLDDTSHAMWMDITEP